MSTQKLKIPLAASEDKFEKFQTCISCTMPCNTTEHEESDICKLCNSWVCRFCLDSDRHREMCKGVQ